ncbi:NAD(P)/FAD-dependent oxidoreductase [Actinomadura mexicana]|uniref:NADH dehydrogenase, FAD-containing subunit n=1 Tax=Actinomadura mexicana TaxID=134959 RepID=A0A239BX99_9ACTN|nr:FAD-dependent oxidoreductase [Actinomadura mexicana]SNS11694.1 NADH dehydrogenase, FAD-containing subunit [Actinomadura mexicana]
MKVIVAGAGYAGTLAANRLAKKVPDAEITVVNPRPDFVERVRLHQQLAGTGRAATPLSRMLRDGVRSRRAAVEKIGEGGLTLDGGETLDFDFLVLAVGSTLSPLPGTVPIGTWEGAEQARKALAALPAGGAVTVAGAGPTGIETAAEVAYARPDLSVRLVGRDLAATLSEGARQRVRAGLERLKVSILEDAVERVEAGERAAGTVRLRSGERFCSDLTLWAVIGGVPDLAARSGLEVDERGRVIVDEYLRSVTDPRVIAAGDCAAVPGSRMSCQTAEPQGAHAADTVARLISGRAPEPYSVQYVASCLSLGRRDGVIQIVRRDDTARRAYFAGRAAAMTKEGVVRGARFSARTAMAGALPEKK